MSILSFSKGPSVSIDYVLTDPCKDLVSVVFEMVDILDEESSEKVFRNHHEPHVRANRTRRISAIKVKSSTGVRGETTRDFEHLDLAPRT